VVAEQDEVSPRVTAEATEVAVAGGGNAALVAALEARARGARVLLLERAAPEWRGGNSKYTRNIRCAHEGIDGSPPYTEEQVLEDLARVSGDEFDVEMARFAIRESRTVPGWMEAHGVTWQAAFRGTLQLGHTNRFFLGGGKALVNTYYRRATEIGVSVEYGATVESAEPAEDWVELAVSAGGVRRRVRARAVVVASGGFEANLEWLKRYWGDAADNYLVRGARENDGLLLRALLDMGAAERGNPRGFHAVACDARSPRYEGGIVTRVDAIPFGIAVNREARRFHDEGEDIWPKRYAVWGRLIAEQPGQVAFALFDDRAFGRFIPAAYPPHVADSIGELAERLGLDRERLLATVEEYNRHVPAEAGYDRSRLDGLSTAPGLAPPKSNWALPIDRPPFRAYPLRPGITFTYLGVAVDRRARVLDRVGAPLAGLFAAGEVMAGTILREGYLGGFGLTIGTVFGRIAGREAAALAGHG
jgi:tricarballylate dehydrogenase